MKLIVEISETLKDIADKEDAKTFSHMMWQAILMDAIKNGTPLDDIRQEIENLEYSWYEVPYENVIDDVIGIIDKHISGKDGEHS